MNVDGRVKVVDGWKRERARSRLRGLTVLIPSPESGRVDLCCRQNFDTGNGNSNRYDLSVRAKPFCPVVRMVYLCSSELGLLPFGPASEIVIGIWPISLFRYGYGSSSIPDPTLSCLPACRAGDRRIAHSLLNRRTLLGQF
jgi:hypothetical protein